MSAALLPCAFCRNVPMAYPRTCDKHSPYNSADRAFPQVRCRCGVSVDGTDWTGVETAVDNWNRRAKSANDKINELLEALEEALDVVATLSGKDNSCDEPHNVDDLHALVARTKAAA